MPRLAFDDANLLIFSGEDRLRFIDGLSSNKIDFNLTDVINTLVLTKKAKIMAQLHLFMLNDMLISITISGDHVKLLNYLNSKILTQQVAINDVTTLNYIDLVYGENTDMVGVTVSEGLIKVNVNGNYGFEIYSVKQNRLPFPQTNIH